MPPLNSHKIQMNACTKDSDKQAPNSPVVGIGDHTVPVEDTTDMLLRPITTGQLTVHEAACSSIQRMPVLLLVASSQEGQQGPGCVHYMGHALL